MSTQANVATALLRLVTSINTTTTRIGTLANLTTVDKTSLVVALNEVKALISSSTLINDTLTNTTNTWSSNKIQTQITTAITALINGAPAAQDTLKELADQIVALTAVDSGLLSFAAVQTLTAPQQLQGCTNIGVGDPAHNYVPAIDANLGPGL